MLIFVFHLMINLKNHKQNTHKCILHPMIIIFGIMGEGRVGYRPTVLIVGSLNICGP